MLKIPLFGKKKLLLAFEYGVLLADVAKQQKVEITRELIEKAEQMIENEFRNQSATFLATNIVPNLLTPFELDLSE
jgi:hypothetical protein